MTTLDKKDQNLLIGLPRDASADAVADVVKEIAKRHGVDWRDWPAWGCGIGGAQTPLTMAVARLDSNSYLPIIEFAFGRFCRELPDVASVRRLFKSFFDTLGIIAGFHAGPGGGAQEADRVQSCLEAFLLAAGPSGAPHAFAALAAAFPAGPHDWLDNAWRAALSSLERDNLNGGLTKSGSRGIRETP